MSAPLRRHAGRRPWPATGAAFHRRLGQPRLLCAVHCAELEVLGLAHLRQDYARQSGGWPGDWIGAPPSRVHEWTVSNDEWIYRGEANDYRTFNGASPNEDITEVRITADETYAHFLIRMQDITSANLPAIGIAWNSHLSTGANWIGDASTPTGSIALENAEQYATREIMFYSAGVTPKIKLWNGSIWYDPPAHDSAIVVSTTDDVIEARINKHDLDLFSPQRVTVALASFRSSGNDTGNDCTFDAVPEIGRAHV